MYAPDPQEKFDFQNMDVKLYLALKELMAEYFTVIISERQDYLQKNAERVMYEFEQSFGPIPDWAMERNWAYELVPGAQLCTKDGRRIGNAHIVKVVNYLDKPVDVSLYECLTDAGSKFTHTEQELLEAFTIGDWISDPARIIRDFDRNGEFRDEQ